MAICRACVVFRLHSKIRLDSKSQGPRFAWTWSINSCDSWVLSGGGWLCPDRERQVSLADRDT